MEGYFQEVKVVPLGTKYRDNRVLTAINWGLVYLCGFHELAQGWTFVRHKHATPAKPIRAGGKSQAARRMQA